MGSHRESFPLGSEELFCLALGKGKTTELNVLLGNSSGERLAMIAVLGDGVNNPYGFCRFDLVVYKAGEPVFHGRYANSLGIRNGKLNGGCQPWGKAPISVSWD